MRVTRIGYALGVAAAVAVFAGCSGNGSSLSSVAPAPGAGGQSIVRTHNAMLQPVQFVRGMMAPRNVSVGKTWQGAAPDAAGTYITACEFFGSVCNLYKQNHNTVVGSIAVTNPNDLCTDKAGNVWIPDAGTQDTVEYAHGSTAPIKSLSGSGVQPSSCAVDANGTVYVGNIVDDSINVYAGGSTTPTSQLIVNSAFAGGSKGTGYVGNLAIDEHHNLAASWVDFNTGAAGVDEFTHAKQAHEHTVLNSVNISGVRFDSAEHIVYTDLGTNMWNVWNGTSVCDSQIATASGGLGLFSAINKPNTKIYTADVILGQVTQESFADCTGGGTIQFEYNAGLAGSQEVEGVAVSPATTN